MSKSKRFTITPKGILVVEFGEKLGTQIWDKLVEIGRRQLDFNEDREGIPALVLHEGGEIISLTKAKP